MPGRAPQPAPHCAKEGERKLPSSERGGGAQALSLDGAGSSLFFLLYFATGANLCWRRLAPAPCQSLHQTANQGRARASNFPVSLLSLLGGVDLVMLQLQLHGVWLFLPSAERPAAPF